MYNVRLQKQLSLQESDEPQSYPTTTSLPRQSTIGTSGVSASSSARSKSAQSNHTPSPASTTNGHSKSVSPVSNTSNNNSKSKTKGIYIPYSSKLSREKIFVNFAVFMPVSESFLCNCLKARWNVDVHFVYTCHTVMLTFIPTAPPPPSDTPPQPRPQASRGSERGALLGSIEGFAKNKLKKAVTNDRSAPKV